MNEIKNRVAVIRDIIKGSELKDNIEIDTALDEIEAEGNDYADEIHRLTKENESLEEENEDLEKVANDMPGSSLQHNIKQVDDGGIDWHCTNANGIALMEALGDALSNPKVNIIQLTNYLNQLAGCYAGIS